MFEKKSDYASHYFVSATSATTWLSWYASCSGKVWGVDLVAEVLASTSHDEQPLRLLQTVDFPVNSQQC